MELRKTIVFIGNSEEDRSRFETAIASSDQRYNFLALDHEQYTITRMNKSQPFWFHAIIIDLSTPSLWAMPFLREVSGIEHLKHVPVVAYINNNSRSYLKMVEEAGARHCVFDLNPDHTLVHMFNALESNTAQPFVLDFPVLSRSNNALMAV